MKHIRTLIALLLQAWQFALGWVSDQVHDIRFYSRLAEDKGLQGLLAAYRVWRSTRRMSEIYGYIEAEIDMHEEQMRWLRIRLKEAQDAQRRALLGLDNLYQEQP